MLVSIANNTNLKLQHSNAVAGSFYPKRDIIEPGSGLFDVGVWD